MHVVPHDILDHQPEKHHIATACALVAMEDAGLEVQKEPFSPKIKHIYGYLFQAMSSYVNFPYLLCLLFHIPTHTSFIQQEQTYHQPQLHCLKSTEHEGSNKTISLPAS